MKNFGFWILDFGSRNGKGRARVRGHAIQNRKSKIQNAFTLTELLIVISIIVIVLLMAVPAFKFIIGSRSTEGAQNQVAALISRARSEAVGLQELRGVFFYMDSAGDRVIATEVRQANPPSSFGQDYIHDVAAPAGKDEVDVYLDLVSESDRVPLPPGVGLQVFDNVAGTVRADDGYIGYNTSGVSAASNTGSNAAAIPSIKVGGVILFDSSGKLVAFRYAFRTRQKDPPPSGTGAFTATDMGRLLYPQRSGGDPDPALAADYVPWSGAGYMARSSIGFVLYDRATFDNNKFTETDTDLAGGSYAANESAEEAWLDANTSPILVNRFNGTLIKGD